MKLTICTVSYESKGFLEENFKLVNKLNSEPEFEWLVGENTPMGSGERIDAADPRFIVIEGLPAPDVEKARNSFHHANTMNYIKEQIHTRYALFLDPDCYIVRPNWIHDIITYMDIKKLSFFGIPWHPRWYMKYRYFPCVHCMFVDLERLSNSDLDFTPGYFDNDERLHSCLNHFESAAGKESSLRRYLLHKAMKWMRAPGLKVRKKIMSSPDVGARVEKKFNNCESINIECAQPVFFPDRHEYMGTLRNRLVEAFLPERLCLEPKRKNYCSKRSFSDCGVFDANAQEWEEFLWKDSPFCFHMRNYPKRKHGSKFHVLNQLEYLQSCLSSL